MYTLPIPICNSLLIIAQNSCRYKAKQDTLWLKAQRNKKQLKDELVL